MLKQGVYRHRHEHEYVEGAVFCGDILLKVRETESSFILTLLEQQVRYDAPQIDDMFQKSDRLVIRKDGSKHGISLCKGQDDWFCLYPYRVGVPYSFEHEDRFRMTEQNSEIEEQKGEMALGSAKTTAQKKAQAEQEAREQPNPAKQDAPAQREKPLPTKITVRAFPNSREGNVLAGLTFDINGCFAIRGAKLVRGKNGAFVSMPQRKMGDGYQEVVFPITKEMRDMINNMAVSAYKLAMTEMTKKMEQTQAASPVAPAPASQEMEMQ